MNLLTPQQVAAKIGRSDTIVLRLIRSGILPAEQVGRIYLIEPKNIKIAENREKKRGRKPGKTKDLQQSAK